MCIAHIVLISEDFIMRTSANKGAAGPSEEAVLSPPKSKVTKKKADYLVLVDRASEFVLAHNMAGTKTRHLIMVLNEYCKVFAGLPLLLSSDRGPQLKNMNRAIPT